MKKKKPSQCQACDSAKITYCDSFWVCANCKYEFVGYLDSQLVNNFYQNEIGLRAQNILEDKEVLRKSGIRSLAFLKQYHKSRELLKLCDIGCGVGLFLSHAKKLGYQVYGYDISKSQSEIAIEKNKLKNVACSQTLENYCKQKRIKSNFFDVITCFEVIEHVPDVNRFLKEVHKYLKKDGVFFMSTPNNDRIQLKERWDYPPIHLSRFKRINIEKFLLKNKFLPEEYATYSELGYYSGNFIAKMDFSHRMLNKMVDDIDRKQTSAQKENTSLQLFKLLAKTKKIVCSVIDIPIYAMLMFSKTKGHTIYLVARKQTV